MKPTIPEALSAEYAAMKEALEGELDEGASGADVRELREHGAELRMAERPMGMPEMDLLRWGQELREAVQQRASLTLKVALLLAYGLDRYGEEAWQYIAEAGLAHHTVENALSVVRAIPLEVLNPDVGKVDWSIFAELAPVWRRDAERGAALLEQAKAEKMTVAELRAVIRPPQTTTATTTTTTSPGAPQFVQMEQTWTLGELLASLAGYSNRRLRNNGRLYAMAWLETLK